MTLVTYEIHFVSYFEIGRFMAFFVEILLENHYIFMMMCFKILFNKENNRNAIVSNFLYLGEFGCQIVQNTC